MILNPISKGGKGLTPEIIVTAPSGSTLDIMQNSVVLQTYTLGSSETSHTFAVESVGEYVVRGTSGTKTKSETVTISEVGQYSVDIFYGLKLYWYGDECESVTGGWLTRQVYEDTKSCFVTNKKISSSNGKIVIRYTADGNARAGYIGYSDTQSFPVTYVEIPKSTSIVEETFTLGSFSNKYLSIAEATISGWTHILTKNSSYLRFYKNYYTSYTADLKVYAIWLE